MSKAQIQQETVEQCHGWCWKKLAKKVRHQPKVAHKQGKWQIAAVSDDGVIEIHDIDGLKDKNLPAPIADAAVDNRIKHPGYAPDSRFAPEVPNSPAYDAVYNQPKPEFHGLDLGIVKLGYNDGGSLDAGVNIGVAKTDVQLGANTRVDAEFMPIGGPIHARTGAGLNFSEDGVRGDVGAGGISSTLPMAMLISMLDLAEILVLTVMFVVEFIQLM
jgi:hypothetical protein